MSRNEDFIRFREQFPVFEYTNYLFVVKDKGLYLRFTFTCGKQVFYPKYFIPSKPFFFTSSLSKQQLKLLAFHIGMIELVSYWKFACSPVVQILCGSLEERQIEFWKKLYFKGLGEFFYTNGIKTTQDTFMTIESQGKKYERKSFAHVKEDFLVPVGGGKDSVVTLEMLKASGCKVTPLIINPREASLNCIAIGGFENGNFFEIKRTIDPLLLELNSKNFLNGHTPFSAMLAFVSLLAAALTGKKYIALSNEISANESTVAGQDINHQYSKSLEFEDDFRNYVSTYITKDLEYFSFLRISELRIAQIFAHLPYKSVFRSCNAGSKQDIWCGHCAKCLFAFIILSPFIDKKELTTIFGRNLFTLSKEATGNENSDAGWLQIKEDFLQLIGTKEQKPFECVGTVGEVNLAVALYIQQNGIGEKDDLIKIWWQLKKSEYESILKQKDEVLSQSNLKNLPPAALKAYQNPDMLKNFAIKSINAPIIAEFSESKIGIFGLGREGKSTYQFFRRIFPEKELILADEAVSIEQFDAFSSDQNVRVYNTESIYREVAPRCDVIFKTPGIPFGKFSQQDRAKITSQTDLFLKHFARQTVGVTGTKGKSTTSNLIFACLQAAGVKSVLVGNIGVPVLDKFYDIDPKTIVVAELSAHQLEKITVAPRYAVFLNIFEEHLDFFGTFDAYKKAKFQIIAKQQDGDFVFYGDLGTNVRKKIENYQTNRQLIPVTVEYYYNYFRKYSIANEKTHTLRIKYLIGGHNLFNVSVAYAVCRQLGLSEHDIIHTCINFKGLPHRLEFVGQVNQVSFYNDSISTTPQSTLAAIKALKNVETLLLGGMDRGINYDILGREIPKFGIKNIALIGKAGQRIGKILKDAGFDCNYLVSDDFEEIIFWAKVVTSKQKSVLLSPAAPSYDQFTNFIQRGETFVKAVLGN